MSLAAGQAPPRRGWLDRVDRGGGRHRTECRAKQSVTDRLSLIGDEAEGPSG